MAAEQDKNESPVMDTTDDSVVTIDEETPEVPLEESLNSKFPTI